jgi:phage recombination protein Bet
MNQVATVATTQRRGIMEQLADRYGLEPDVFRATIKATCMPPNASVEEFIACCMVAYEHGLNPITKEIYFMKTRGGSIQPIVSVDGWIRKCNEHPQFDGLEFVDNLDEGGKTVSSTCVIHRKDRSHPTRVTEDLAECMANGGPVWKTAPKRMLRHRALTQAARYAFGFAGVMDRDEFDQWQSQELRDITPATPLTIPDIPEPTPAIDDIPDVAQVEPDTIADVEGFLAKLYEDAELCSSEDDLRELEDGNAEIIARLPADAQERARAILRIPE